MMHAAVIRTYGDESVFEIQDNLTPPEPKSNQVLVKISASSVNPIDLMKREGYNVLGITLKLYDDIKTQKNKRLCYS